MRIARFVVSFALTVLVSAVSHAQDAPVVVELFTSQGCSSCPPAEAFLTDLARQRQDVLPLAFHVTYWNNLGWKDPYSLDAATSRQRDYARSLGDDGVYTPQMVVDGASGFVGSSRAQALNEIARAAPKQVPVRLARNGETLVASIGAGVGLARVLLVGYDVQHQTLIRAGENGGRTVLETNIVRSLTQIAVWNGAASETRQATPAGEAFAVILQAETGRIIGAARLGKSTS